MKRLVTVLDRSRSGQTRNGSRGGRYCSKNEVWFTKLLKSNLYGDKSWEDGKLEESDLRRCHPEEYGK